MSGKSKYISKLNNFSCKANVLHIKLLFFQFNTLMSSAFLFSYVFWEEGEDETCLRDTGKVNRAHCWSVLTASLVAHLHDRQTAAQATTFLLSGHATSLSSTLCTMSKSSSDGRWAHLPVCSISSWYWLGRCHAFGHMVWLATRLCPALPSPLLDVLPMPSFISFSSLTKLFSDISLCLLLSLIYTSLAWIEEKLEIAIFQSPSKLVWKYYLE